MGIALWVASGTMSFILARLIRPGRSGRWLPELLLAIVVAVILGGVASALDFGGWREPDWRAGLFALAGSYGGIGLIRLTLMWRRSSDRRSPA